MMFLIRYGFIVGWSILTAVFLQSLGIGWLPILFLGNALLMMIGTCLYRPLLQRFPKELLITATVIVAAFLLIVAGLVMAEHPKLFILLVLIAESILGAQLAILISLFNESLFNPLESERTFPLIESAETLGGIFGGLTLTFFASDLAPYKFILLWALALLFLLPIVLKYNGKALNLDEEPEKTLVKSFKEIRKFPFLKGLIFVIVLHWAMMNIIEFQYTKAVQLHVLSQGHFTAVVANQLIAKQLGSLHVLFNLAALFMQLLFASRILSSAGVLSTMLIHPLATLLNVAGMQYRFNFFTSTLARGSYEITSLLFKNAFDLSFYALAEEVRMHAKELLQGLMKPLGAILGTLAIVVIASQTSTEMETFLLNLILIAMGLAMAVILIELRPKYTDLSEQNLSRQKGLLTRLQSVQILSQKGHRDLSPALIRLLKRDYEPDALKCTILKTLAKRQELQHVGEILHQLSSESDQIRLNAIRALREYKNLKENLMNQSFTKFQLLEQLKKRLETETEFSIKEEVVYCWHQWAPDGLMEFLVKRIESIQDPDAIRMLGIFKDPNLKHFLLPYLEHQSKHVRIATIHALWSFPELNNTLKHHLQQILESPHTEHLKLAIEACGNLKIHDFTLHLKKHLEHDSDEIKDAALLALAQLKHSDILHLFLSKLLDVAHPWFEKRENILRKLPKEFRLEVEKLWQQHVSQHFSEFSRLKHRILPL